MQIRVITMRYSEGIQGFSEDALRRATFGREVLAVGEHFMAEAIPAEEKGKGGTGTARQDGDGVENAEGSRLPLDGNPQEEP